MNPRKKKPETESQKLFTCAYVASRLCLDPRTVRAAVERGEIGSVRVGKLRKIPLEALIEYMHPSIALRLFGSDADVREYYKRTFDQHMSIEAFHEAVLDFLATHRKPSDIPVSGWKYDPEKLAKACEDAASLIREFLAKKRGMERADLNAFLERSGAYEGRGPLCEPGHLEYRNEGGDGNSGMYFRTKKEEWIRPETPGGTSLHRLLEIEMVAIVVERLGPSK